MGSELQDTTEFYQLPPEKLAGIRASLWENAMSNAQLVLSGGAYLTAFALLMGAQPIHIGLIASLPPLSNLLQVVGSYIVQKTGQRKRLTIICSFWSRLVWALIIALPWVVFRWQVNGLGFLITFLAISNLLAALGGAAWLSWLTDMVPPRLRGRFLSRRSIIAGVTGMAVSLSAGFFLDIWNVTYHDPFRQALGIIVLFSVGFLAGMWSQIWLKRMPEEPMAPQETVDFAGSLRRPLVDGDFRALLVFNAVWTLGVGVASPFFAVYMIQYLALPFSMIAALQVVSSISNILSLRLWGRVTDELGAKPFLRICCMVAGLLPLLWLSAQPSTTFILWPLHVLMGMAWSGIGVCSFALLMNVSPAEANASYYAVFASVAGITGAMAPFLGGLLAEVLANVRANVGPLLLENLHFVFLLSAGIRMGTALFILPRVRVPADMKLSDTLRTLASIQRQGMVIGTRRMASMGAQAMENTGTAVARGAMVIQKRFGKRLAKPVSLARVLGRNASGVERLLLNGSRWLERRMDRMARKVAALIPRRAVSRGKKRRPPGEGPSTRG